MRLSFSCVLLKFFESSFFQKPIGQMVLFSMVTIQKILFRNRGEIKCVALIPRFQDNQAISIRQPPELYVSPKLSYSEQVGVAVSVLLNENKDGYVDWMKRIVARAVDERQAWESEVTARRMEEVTLDVDQEIQSGNPKDSQTAAPIVVTADTEERKTMMSKDPKAILLLKLLGFKGSSQGIMPPTV